ncbi:sporulation protein YyaC [Gottschalkia purinilytica]|uniref:Sporulation protein YyaC n=1 Tax=Gottschalkia purinilytica TaxID=1503 RepID=A0A0L0W6H4_GOTPU|nr:spore protease YyaC [Gottschalkia purinilytica]KNF07091.1 sporulation protein YyaC [Gottschalkia purinilytica]
MSIHYKKRNVSIDSSSPLAKSNLNDILLEYLDNYYDNSYDKLVILCIGTDRSTGDSLGPLIGYKLYDMLKIYPNVLVLGTLDSPVHAKNLEKKIEWIYSQFKKPFIIAIDACLGKQERIGYINICKGSIKPGAGVNKVLPEVGDMHITGIVNFSGFMEYIVLQNTRLNLVMRIADIVSSSLIISLWRFFKKQKELNQK